MDIESDLPEDEEEILVYVEFEGFVDSKTFSNEKLQLDMIGLDLDFPIMQVNGKFYEGTYEDAVGTYMFFEKDDNPIVDDPMFDTIPTLKYFTKTRKLLKMQRIFTMPRSEVLGDSNHSNCIPNMDTIRQAGVPPKYQEKALQFWTKMRDDRMEALNMYLKKQKIREEKKLQGIKPDSESDEDNPFAMYKHNKFDGVNAKDTSEDVSVDVEGNEKVLKARDTEGILLDSTQLEELSEGSGDDAHKLHTKSQRKLTVKDAGLSIVESNIDEIVSSTVRRKHRATVKVVRKGKGSTKSSKKVIRKKQVFASEEKLNDDIIKDKQQGCRMKIDKNVAVQEMEAETEIIDTSAVSGSRENVESETSVLKEFETVTNVSSSTSKKLEKQAKREAKMKEISEKVKKLGEKSRNDETDNTSII